MKLWILLAIIYGFISLCATGVEIAFICDCCGCLTIGSLREEGFNWFGTTVLLILQILFVPLIYIAAFLGLAFKSKLPDWFE